MQTDLATLRERVRELTRASPVAPHVEDVVIESDWDNEGSDFLRVKIKLFDSENINVRDLESLLKNIEDVIGKIDERYPSVRFLDAA